GQRAQRGGSRRGSTPDRARRCSGVQRVPRYLRDLHLHRAADSAFRLLYPRLRGRRHRPDSKLAGGCGG
nr:hypothetical protein [Tanacetum cinerariifolium]